MKSLWLFLFILIFSNPLLAQWQAFGEGVTNEGDGYVAVYAMAAYENLLYIGGSFTHVDGVEASFVAKWDGQNWQAVGEGLTMNDPGVYYAGVRALKVFNGELYAAGIFNQSGDTPVHHIAKWDGETWIDMGMEIAGNSGEGVLSMEIFKEHLYVGGNFNGQAQYRSIAKYDGSSWSTVGDGIQQGLDNRGLVRDLRTFGGLLYIGGQFEKSGSVYSENLITWDGSIYLPVGMGATGDYGVTRTGYFGTNLVVAGGFTEIHDEPLQNIGMYNTMDWMSLDQGVGQGGGNSYEVQAIIEYQNDLVVGGHFQQASGVYAPGIARWDGTTWNNYGTFGDGSILSLIEFQGAIIAGGSFTQADENTVYHLAWRNPPVNTSEQLIEQNTVRIYPNPNTGRVWVEFADNPSVSNIHLLDELGRLLPVHWENQGTLIEVILDHLPTGVYYLKISSEQGSRIEKIIKMGL